MALPSFPPGGIFQLIKLPFNLFGKKTVEGLYNTAVDLYEAGNYQGVLKLLAQAKEMDAEWSTLHYTEGLCLQKLEQPEAAKEAFQESLRLNPDDSDCLYNLARLYYNEDNLDVALAYAEQALVLVEDDATYYLLGLIYEQQERVDEAINAYEKSLLFNPDQPLVGLFLSKLYMKFQEYEKADKLLRMAVESDPHNLAINYELSLCLAKLGQWEETIAYSRRVIELDPVYTKAYNQLGLALYCTENLAEAVVNYERALHIDPTYSTALNNLAYTYEKMENYPKAIEKFTLFLPFVHDRPEEVAEIEEHIDILRQKMQE